MFAQLSSKCAALLAGSVVLLATSLAAAPAHAAIVLTAADAICTSDDNGGNDTVFLTGCNKTGLDLLYKANRDPASESGPFATNYSTSFVPATEADITWDGPAAIDCPECYVIAKDGNSTPNWFLFDLATWDGMETIEFSPLFFSTNASGKIVNQAFSHVSIWGKDGGGPGNGNGNGGGPGNGNGNGVPEPATLALVGLGLLGAAASRRRRRG